MTLDWRSTLEWIRQSPEDSAPTEHPASNPYSSGWLDKHEQTRVSSCLSTWQDHDLLSWGVCLGPDWSRVYAAESLS